MKQNKISPQKALSITLTVMSHKYDKPKKEIKSYSLAMFRCIRDPNGIRIIIPCSCGGKLFWSEQDKSYIEMHYNDSCKGVVTEGRAK